MVTESESHFRRLIEQSPVSIQIHGLGGKLLLSNDAYAKLYALSDETLNELYEKYNVRTDAQAEALGVKPFIERVYAGEQPKAAEGVRVQLRQAKLMEGGSYRW